MRIRPRPFGYWRTSSTRRFCWRPSGVSLLATGFEAPTPFAASRAGSIPNALTRYALTAAARGERLVELLPPGRHADRADVGRRLVAGRYPHPDLARAAELRVGDVGHALVAHVDLHILAVGHDPDRHEPVGELLLPHIPHRLQPRRPQPPARPVHIHDRRLRRGMLHEADRHIPPGI